MVNITQLRYKHCHRATPRAIYSSRMAWFEETLSYFGRTHYLSHSSSFAPSLSRSLALPFSHSPGRLASHKVGWCLRIMAAEGRGSGHLANAAPICFYERGEEFSEDTTLTRTTRSAAKRGRLKIKLVNILPVSPRDAHFSVQELIAAAIYITKTEQENV